MSIKLTKTELEVAKLYYEYGLKPREIAEKLKISINTVYKALSKYRNYVKEKGLELPENEYVITKENVVDLNQNNQKISVSRIDFSINIQLPNYLLESSLHKNSHINNNIINSYQEHVKLLVDELKNLKNIIQELIIQFQKLQEVLKSFAQLSNVSQNIKHVEIENVETVNQDIPEFMKNNIWIDIIRSKYST